MTHRDNKLSHQHKMGAKYEKENIITPLCTLNIEVILHYITLTSYDIVNDT